jgi:mannitol-1-/sugar-/sorbitol-6-phosphatase
VLFDCDGVLVDSESSVVRAWTRWAHDHGLDPEAVLPLIHGRRAEETVRDLITAEHRAVALGRIDRLELADAANVVAVAGAARLLGRIPEHQWAVVTSGTDLLARARLAAAGLPLPDVLVTSDDVYRGKPDPQGYVQAATRLGLPPVDTVVVEDTARGIEAARAAGVSAVVGVSERTLGTDADVVVADLTCLDWAAGILVRRDGVLRRG